ncbi:MAG: hypothetical protein RL222_1672 [Bacteroidota bacterium]
MKRLIAILIVLFACLNTHAQQLRLSFSDSIISKPFYIWIKTYQEGTLLIYDSILVSATNKQNISVHLPNYTGYTEITTGNSQQRGIGIIFQPKEKEAHYQFNLQEFQSGNFNFIHSPENIAYNLLLEYMDTFYRQLDDIREKRNQLSRFDSAYLNKVLKSESQQDKLYKEINLIADSVLKKDPGLYTALLANFLKTPNTYSHPKLSGYFDNYDALLHHHFFDFIDFSNEQILNHPMLGFKIEEYFNAYCHQDNNQEGVDMLIKKSSVNEKVKNFIFNYLVEYFLKRKNDQMVTYLNGQFADGCGLQLSPEKLKEFSSIIHTQTGSKIPDIVMYDSKGELRSIYTEAAKNKYTLIYIWMSSCHACQTKTPYISELAASYLKKGLGVMSISLDDKKEQWLSSILQYKLTPFINLSELTTLKKSTILPKLNIRTTPKLFIIDSNGIILTKDVYQDELKQKLAELFKK